jgi:NAD(P)-dependent dehydrogenase (short-subunit alcohol dehydrogenase family)
MNELNGMTAIVTGAAQGLGKSFAERLTSEGCNVAITDKRPGIDLVGKSLGALSFQGDVSDSEHVHQVVSSTVEEFGTVDILVNNAGEVLPTGPLDAWDQAADTFERIFCSNTKGAYLFGRAVAPIMAEQKSGNILNVSTDHVKPAPHALRHHGHGSMDLYNASKWALNGLTFDWAKSLEKYNIRVNNLCVGATDTEMLRKWSGPDPDPAWVESWMDSAIVAGVVVDLFLEGPEGRTGDNIGLYAGYDCVLPPPETE